VLLIRPSTSPLLRSWRFLQLEQKNKLDSLPYLVYRYDARKRDDNPQSLDHCYSLVARDELLSYEEGEQQGLGQIPPHIQQRFLMDGESSLTAEDRHQMNILREKELDAGKQLSERIRGYANFAEAYELLTLAPASSTVAKGKI
jgi:hypothetical protein